MLELVLALPVLMLMMGLMINYGSLACWGVRSQVVARNTIWKHRWPRRGQFDPQPTEWPDLQGANMSTGQGRRGGSPMDVLDDPAYNNPLLKGPMPGVQVNADFLDPTDGVRIGTANLRKVLPIATG